LPNGFSTPPTKRRWPRRSSTRSEPAAAFVCLTLLGGGVYGNRDEWTMGAIERAFLKRAQHGLDVRIVSYSRSKPIVAELVSHLNRI
jgi:hypothetical protein